MLRFSRSDRPAGFRAFCLLEVRVRPALKRHVGRAARGTAIAAQCAFLHAHGEKTTRAFIAGENASASRGWDTYGRPPDDHPCRNRPRVRAPRIDLVLGVSRGR